MKRLTIILAAVCVLQTGAIIYFWTAKRDVHRFQYLTGDGAFDTKTALRHTEAEAGVCFRGGYVYSTSKG